MNNQDRDDHGMSLARFTVIVEAYGSEPRRWPVAERAAAETLLAASAEARALRDAAAALDTALSLSRAPAPSAALRSALLQAAPRQDRMRPASRGSWQALPGILAGELGGLRPAGAMLGTALLLGILAGGVVGAGVAPSTEPAIDADIDVIQLAMFDDQIAEY